MGLMNVLNKLMFIDRNGSSAYSLDDVIGKAVMNPELGAPELTNYEFKGKDKDRDLAYLSLGYLSNIPEKDIDTEKLKESNPKAYESFKESVNKLSVLQYYYGLFKNMAYNDRICNAIVGDRGRSVAVGNLTNVEGMSNSIKYLQEEIFQWNKYHTCGLPNYFDNALNILKNFKSNYGSKKKKEKDSEMEFNNIVSELKKGNTKLFLKACKLKAGQLESEGADYTKYFNTLLAQSVTRLYNRVSIEDKNMETTNELVFHYLAPLERTKLFKIDENAKDYLPPSIVDIINKWEKESKKIEEKESAVMHVDMSRTVPAEGIKAEG